MSEPSPVSPPSQPLDGAASRTSRIVLPKELRTNMRLETDTKLEIFVDGDSIILKKHRPIGSCDFCGEVDDKAVHYAGYCICSECRQRISEL